MATVPENFGREITITIQSVDNEVCVMLLSSVQVSPHLNELIVQLDLIWFIYICIQRRMHTSNEISIHQALQCKKINSNGI